MSAELEEVVPVAASVLCSHVFSKDTWYLIQIVDNGYRRHYLRNFPEMVDFDKTFRESIKSVGGRQSYGKGTSVTDLESLPAAGSRFGLRKQLSNLGIGKFNENRQKGIQMYLDVLMGQLKSLSEEPMLDEFFGDSPITADPKRAEDDHETLLDVLDELVSFYSARTEEDAVNVVFPKDTKVQIVGLYQTKSCNGAIATVRDWEPETLSYVIFLEDGQLNRIDAINLRTVPSEEEMEKVGLTRRERRYIKKKADTQK